MSISPSQPIVSVPTFLRWMEKQWGQIVFHSVPRKKASQQRLLATAYSQSKLVYWPYWMNKCLKSNSHPYVFHITMPLSFRTQLMLILPNMGIPRIKRKGLKSVDLGQDNKIAGNELALMQTICHKTIHKNPYAILHMSLWLMQIISPINVSFGWYVIFSPLSLWYLRLPLDRIG